MDCRGECLFCSKKEQKVQCIDCGATYCSRKCGKDHFNVGHKYECDGLILKEGMRYSSASNDQRKRVLNKMKILLEEKIAQEGSLSAQNLLDMLNMPHNQDQLHEQPYDTDNLVAYCRKILKM